MAAGPGRLRRGRVRRAVGALEDLGRLDAGIPVVAKRDRLARDVLIVGAIEAAAASRGARVVSADGVADGDEPAALLMGHLLDAFAQFERAMIRARTRAALAMKKARGERVGGIPHGYELAGDGKRLVIHPGDATVVARAQELRALGLTLQAVAERRAAEGLRNREGRLFGPSSVLMMVRRPTAARAA